MQILRRPHVFEATLHSFSFLPDPEQEVGDSGFVRQISSQGTRLFGRNSASQLLAANLAYNNGAGQHVAQAEERRIHWLVHDVYKHRRVHALDGDAHKPVFVARRSPAKPY